MNSENNRTSKYNVLILKLTDKLDLRKKLTFALLLLNIFIQ